MIVCSPGTVRLSSALRIRWLSVVPALFSGLRHGHHAVNADAAASVIGLLNRRW